MSCAAAEGCLASRCVERYKERDAARSFCRKKQTDNQAVLPRVNSRRRQCAARTPLPHATPAPGAAACYETATPGQQRRQCGPHACSQLQQRHEPDQEGRQRHHAGQILCRAGSEQHGSTSAARLQLRRRHHTLAANACMAARAPVAHARCRSHKHATRRTCQNSMRESGRMSGYTRPHTTSSVTAAGTAPSTSSSSWYTASSAGTRRVRPALRSSSTLSSGT